MKEWLGPGDSPYYELKFQPEYNRPFGIDYWLTKNPTLFGRLKNFLSWLNPIPKELRPMTKKKLQARITELERRVKMEEGENGSWRRAHAVIDKKHKALQQAVCDLTKEAGLAYVEETICIPESNRPW